MLSKRSSLNTIIDFELLEVWNSPFRLSERLNRVYKRLMIEGKLDVVETALNRLWALIADRNLAPGQGSSSAPLNTYSALRKDFQDFKESKIPTYQEYLRLKNLWDFLLYAIQQGLKPSEFLQELPSETARKMVEERLREYSKLSENSYIRKLLRLIEEEKQNECRDSKEST